MPEGSSAKKKMTLGKTGPVPKRKKKEKTTTKNGDGEVRGHGDESSPATANLRS